MNDEIRAQIKEVVEFFMGKPVNNDVLAEFCNRRKFELVTMSQYEDYLFQYQHDKRASTIVPLVLAEMAKLQIPPELGTASERNAVFANNNMVELAISKIFEDNGIVYHEADTLAKNMGMMFQGVMSSVGNRVNNMGTATIIDIAEKVLGKPLTVEACARYFRKEADALARAKEKVDEVKSDGADEVKVA